MVPSKQSCHPEFISLSNRRRQVTADFTGGQITSDAGLALAAQLDRHYRITKRLNALKTIETQSECNTL